LKENKLKIFAHLSCNTNLSLLGMQYFYGVLLINPKMIDEIIYIIENNAFPSQTTTLCNCNQTVSDFVVLNEHIITSYINFIEHICEIIPNIDS
jgi:hypothetical protein